MTLHEFTRDNAAKLNPGATPQELERLQALFPGAQQGLLDMLGLFDGERDEDALIPGASLLSIDGIVEMAEIYQEMVADDGLQPPAFLHFIPFISTALKTEVGVFASTSPFEPGAVGEMCCERGEIAIWAASFEQFIERMLAVAGSDEPDEANMPGYEFPPEGVRIVDTNEMPGSEA